MSYADPTCCSTGPQHTPENAAPEKTLSGGNGDGGDANGFKDNLLLRFARSLRKNEQAYHLTVAGFKLLQRAGISISPNHYYWPVPSLEQLETRQWSSSAMCGVDLRMERQLDFLQQIVPRYGPVLN